MYSLIRYLLLYVQLTALLFFSNKILAFGWWIFQKFLRDFFQELALHMKYFSTTYWPASSFVILGWLKIVYFIKSLTLFSLYRFFLKLVFGYNAFAKRFATESSSRWLDLRSRHWILSSYFLLFPGWALDWWPPSCCDFSNCWWQILHSNLPFFWLTSLVFEIWGRFFLIALLFC